MTHRQFLAGIALATLAVAVSADQPKALRVASPDFGWLAESWCFETAGAFIEETWLPARGSLMLGVSRSMNKAGGAPDFEYLRIETIVGVTNYIAQPGGRSPTYFKLTKSERHFARFENPQHDFPQYIEYRRTGDRLSAEIGAIHAGGDTARKFTFEYQICQ